MHAPIASKPCFAGRQAARRHGKLFHSPLLCILPAEQAASCKCNRQLKIQPICRRTKLHTGFRRSARDDACTRAGRCGRCDLVSLLLFTLSIGQGWPGICIRSRAYRLSTVAFGALGSNWDANIPVWLREEACRYRPSPCLSCHQLIMYAGSAF